MNLNYIRLNGEEARVYVEELANIRLKVFWEFPYLYQGTLDYEKKYLETYFKAKHSFIFIIKDNGKCVGATTAIWAQEEEESFRQPFINYGLDPQKILYLGESLLLPEYRGKGLGKIFFLERQNFADSLDFVEWLSFCAVKRESTHPLRPKDYRPLDEFWKSQGFNKAEGLTTIYDWQDRDKSNTTKKMMEFWIKKMEKNT